jgi:hypothetical protein
MKKDKIMRAAQRRAGMPGFPKADVIRVVCERMTPMGARSKDEAVQ